MVAFAAHPGDQMRKFAVKFYFTPNAFAREKNAIAQPALKRAMPACVDIVDDVTTRQLPAGQGMLPLMIITEKGECLSEFVKRKAPDFVTSMQVPSAALPVPVSARMGHAGCVPCYTALQVSPAAVPPWTLDVLCRAARVAFCGAPLEA
jgi:hypothetical protein